MNKVQKTRIDLAVEQLDVALELFLDKRSYVSALTLAGAAEEILGKALNLQSRSNALSRWHGQVDEVWGVPWKEYVQKTNKARNAAKHLFSNKELMVDFNPADEAVWMLLRACENYELLLLDYEKTDRMWEFEEWFHNMILNA